MNYKKTESEIRENKRNLLFGLAIGSNSDLANISDGSGDIIGISMLRNHHNNKEKQGQ